MDDMPWRRAKIPKVSTIRSRDKLGHEITNNPKRTATKPRTTKLHQNVENNGTI
jgi:hypothetical protein